MASIAPWKQALDAHIQTLACPTFSLATASQVGGLTAPHVRTLVFRGFYAELPVNKYNPVSGNTGFRSDLIAFTTDKRMEKFRDLGGVEGVASSSLPTVTNNVEACFWIPSDENPMIGKQWRIRGRCFVLPRDLETEDRGVKQTKKWLIEKLSREGGGDGSGFDFAKEYKAHFGNLSPVLRGSFRNPLPGAPKELGDGGLMPKCPIGDDQLDEEVALSHFRVAVIEPTRVEYLDLEGRTKTIWVPVGSDAEKNEKLENFGKVADSWREVEVWP
ncbi:uncharacterized protein DFL_004902 [Arthrobotrys flagrans]|uniref:Pyridoxamine 5'-phosphate oxidase Alr4036 family FMN-binding domain-containing protein n=1 Tax=Arthrobotrys flagrans TaxID=97331 RepID=A0A437A6B1_ARTFL|nr:hypothetical protein DFL_004902 [Arthrobotrys flagrans]